MGSRCQYFIKLLRQLMDRFLRPRESDCIRLLRKDTTSSRAGRLANCRNPPPKLVKPAIREDKEFFENLPATEGILKISQCQLGVSLVARRRTQHLVSIP